jgi:hypothetical protein
MVSHCPGGPFRHGLLGAQHSPGPAAAAAAVVVAPAAAAAWAGQAGCCCCRRHGRQWVAEWRS